MLFEISIPETGLDTEHLLVYVKRINDSIEHDTSLAIGSTKELIEATLKTILNGCSFDFYDKKYNIPKLLKKVQEVLEIEPKNIDSQKQGAETIKKVLSSIGQIAVGIAELRNLYGSGHGRGDKIQGITARHAKFVVGSGVALCTFLLETYEHRDNLKLEHLKSKFSRNTYTFETSNDVYCIDIHPNNNILASGGRDHKVTIWDLSTGKDLYEHKRYYYESKSGDVRDLTFSNDGKFIITTGFASISGSFQDDEQRKMRKIQVLNWKTGEVVNYLPKTSQLDISLTVELCPGKNVIAFTSQNRIRQNKIQLYDVDLRKIITTCDNQLSRINSISFSPDGNILVAGCQDGQIILWNWQESNLTEKLINVSASVNDVTFNSDNQLIAIGRKDNKITIFDRINKKTIFELDGHVEAVNSLMFSPYGEILASASKDDTVKLWHVKSGTLLRSIECNSRGQEVFSVAFSSDGKTLAAGLSGGQIKIWQ